MRSRIVGQGSEKGMTQTRSLFTQRKPRPIRRTLTWALFAFGATFGVAYHLDSRGAVHRWIAMPLLHTFTDPETAQKLAIKLLSLGIMPRDLGIDDDVLSAEIAGRTLKNPIGLAAGFDKQGEAIDGLLDLGFGIVEIGSVTPNPQPGNDKPRYFRLMADRAAINRYGFNSDGHSAVLGRLKERVQRWILSHSKLSQSRIPLPDSDSKSSALLEDATIDEILASEDISKSLKSGQLLAVNLGKNKTSAEDSVEDYVKGVRTLGAYADLLVVNISSPNTPGLRSLQRKDLLAGLMKDVVTARDQLPKKGNAKVPIFVKIAPDLDTSELHDIADAATSTGIEGLIVSNTTISRPASLKSAPEVTKEIGGLSGAPVKPLALSALQTVRKRVGSSMSIIGCGGIYSGQDALDFAHAGADAVELYTSFGYEGVGHPRRVKDELTALLKKSGTTWKASVGQGLQRGDELPKLPSAEKDSGQVGGVHERFGEAVASVKGELEAWRNSLGMSGEAQQYDLHPSQTARPVAFRPPPSDKEYVNLLDKVHEALGIKADDNAQRNDTVTADLTKAEALRAKLGIALQDPSLAPSKMNQGAGEKSTESTPTSARLTLSHEETRTGQKIAPRSTPKPHVPQGRIGMGGKAEFNAVDRNRVV